MKIPKVNFSEPFKCCKCAWTEPHGHRGALAISLSDFISRGDGLVKVEKGQRGDKFIELLTLAELNKMIADMGPETQRSLHEAQQRADAELDLHKK